MEVAVGWPIGMALSLFVVLANIFLMIRATRRSLHIVGPMALVAVAACVALLEAVVETTRPSWTCEFIPDSLFNSVTWLYWFSGVAISSIAIQGLFGVRHLRYLARSAKR